MKSEIADLKSVLVGQEFMQNAVAYACVRNPGLLVIERERVLNLAKKAALEMAAFEELAQVAPLRVPKTPEEVKKIKAVYDLSFAGTYLKEFQDDRYKDKSWAAWTDRRRLNYSATLIRRLTEKITGNSFRVPLAESLSPQQINQLRSDIEQFGPYLIYGSTLEQNEDLEIALGEQGVIIPKSKVFIISDRVVNTNTVDQMQTFRLPPGLQVQKGDILAVVAHAPHMVRMLHILNQYRPFPEGMIVKPYPMPAPPFGGIDFATQEISGVLYYTFITKDSSEEIHPYKI